MLIIKHGPILFSGGQQVLVDPLQEIGKKANFWYSPRGDPDVNNALTCRFTKCMGRTPQVACCVPRGIRYCPPVCAWRTRAPPPEIRLFEWFSDLHAFLPAKGVSLQWNQEAGKLARLTSYSCDTCHFTFADVKKRGVKSQDLEENRISGLTAEDF